MMTRPMTDKLAAALDAMTAADRRQLHAIAGKSEIPWLRSVLLGIKAEVSRLERREDVAKIREGMVLHDLEADHQAEVDALAEGATWHTEPEDRSKGVAWFPEQAPDTIEGLQ